LGKDDITTRYNSASINYSSGIWGLLQPIDIKMVDQNYYQKLLDQTYPVHVNPRKSQSLMYFKGEDVNINLDYYYNGVQHTRHKEIRLLVELNNENDKEYYSDVKEYNEEDNPVVILFTFSLERKNNVPEIVESAKKLDKDATFFFAVGDRVEVE